MTVTERATASEIATGERVVWKYDLDGSAQELHVGADARVVHVGADPAGESFAIVWVEHTLDGSSLTLPLVVHGTGHPVDVGEFHVGTAISPSGFVWHVYRQSSG